MILREVKMKLQDNKSDVAAVVIAGALIGVGFVLGSRFQRMISLEQLRNVTSFTKELSPMFPNTMPISEIKTVLSTMDGVEMFDALVVNIDGIQKLIVRNI